MLFTYSYKAPPLLSSSACHVYCHISCPFLLLTWTVFVATFHGSYTYIWSSNSYSSNAISSVWIIAHGYEWRNQPMRTERIKNLRLIKGGRAAEESSLFGNFGLSPDPFFLFYRKKLPKLPTLSSSRSFVLEIFPPRSRAHSSSRSMAKSSY